MAHRIGSLGYRRLFSKTNEVSLWVADTPYKSKVHFSDREQGFALAVGDPVVGETSGPGNKSVITPAAEPASAIFDRYLAEGDRAFTGLEGEYAVAIWDESIRSLKIVRDDAGARLVYFIEVSPGSVYFSTGLADLVKVVGKPPISEKGLWEFLRFLDISPPFTIYRDIWFLDPGDILSVQGDKCNTYKKPSAKATALDFLEPALSPETAFERLFRESIALRVRGTERLGVFLSGGIDSSLVCAVASKLRPDIAAYTVGFEDDALDESRIAGGIAAFLGVEHRTLKFTLEDDFEAFMGFTRDIASPFSDPAAIPSYQMFKIVGREVDTILDGTGADTAIGIMPARHLRFILRISRHFPAALRRVIVQALRCNRGLSRYVGLFDFEDEHDPLIRWHGWKSPEIARLTGKKVDLSHTAMYRLYAENAEKDPYELYSLILGSAPDDRIHQCSALFGPRVALPFLDKAVHAYLSQLPRETKYSKKEPKKLFRRLLEKKLPRRLWDVPKHGFDYPFDRLLRFRSHALVNEFLSSEALKKHALFEPREVEALVQRFIHGDASVRFKIWGIVIFQAWYANFYQAI